jgi:hypothetical protein
VAKVKFDRGNKWECASVTDAAVVRLPEGVSWYFPGSYADMPDLKSTAHANVYFAGDTVRTRRGSWFQEKAFVTGVEAANLLMGRPVDQGVLPVSADEVHVKVGKQVFATMKTCRTSHSHVQKSLHRRPVQHRQELSAPPMGSTSPTSSAKFEPTPRLPYQTQTVCTGPTPRRLRLQPNAASTSRYPRICQRKAFHSWYLVSTRGTWSPHAVDGWYLGPATKHYRCYRVWIWDTRAERIADTLSWFPTKVAMPNASSTDLAIAAARDLITALQYPSPASPLSPASDSQLAALQQLANIFATVTKILPTPSPATTPTVPPGFPPLPRVSPIPAAEPSPAANPATRPSPPPFPASEGDRLTSSTSRPQSPITSLTSSSHIPKPQQ